MSGIQLGNKTYRAGPATMYRVVDRNRDLVTYQITVNNHTIVIREQDLDIVLNLLAQAHGDTAGRAQR